MSSDFKAWWENHRRKEEQKEHEKDQKLREELKARLENLEREIRALQLQRHA